MSESEWNSTSSLLGSVTCCGLAPWQKSLIVFGLVTSHTTPREKLSNLKNVISFTDKTRFLYMVNKGKVGEEHLNRQYVVNEPMEHEERPVPFENMVYIGDGPTDIPCFSLVTAMGGYAVGILGKDKPHKAWALGYGRRVNATVPPDFSEGGYAYDHLREVIVNRARSIREQ